MLGCFFIFLEFVCFICTFVLSRVFMYLVGIKYSLPPEGTESCRCPLPCMTAPNCSTISKARFTANTSWKRLNTKQEKCYIFYNVEPKAGKKPKMLISSENVLCQNPKLPHDASCINRCGTVGLLEEKDDEELQRCSAT